MATRKTPPVVEETPPSLAEPAIESETADNPAPIEGPPGPDAPTFFVTQDEHDHAIRALRVEIGDLQQGLADLFRVVTAPTGSVQFKDFTPSDSAVPVIPEPEWYQPPHLQ